MISRLIKAAIIAAVLALVIESLPDMKRYLEIREMLFHAPEGCDERGKRRSSNRLRGRLLGRHPAGAAGFAGSTGLGPGDMGVSRD